MLLLSSTVICSASSDSDSSIVWLPLSVRDSLLLNFFILSVGCVVKNSASAGTRTSPGRRAERTSERADAGPAVAVAAAAQRRLRLRPPLAPSAPRGPPAASRVPEPPAQHGSRAAEPHGRPSYSPVGSRSPGRSKAAGRRGAAGPWGDRETAAAALVRLRARRFLSLGGCGLTPPPVPRSERERRKKKKKDFY